MLYHKINSIYKRDEQGKFIDGDFSRPEYGLLLHNQWIFTEKIDGTNIRVHWDGEKVTFGGRTENAQIPAELFNYLTETFPAEKFKEFKPCILYGEGYGNKIQKIGKNYLPDSQQFILFDVYFNDPDLFCERVTVDEIAQTLEIKSVPILYTCSLNEAIDKIKNGGELSHIAQEELIIEGVIGVPCGDFRNRNGNRIITKIKVKDFQ